MVAVGGWGGSQGGQGRRQRAELLCCFPPAQILPLWAVIGLAGSVCGGFMFKYFTSHTEVNWNKKNRMTHDNQGIGDVSAHNSRFGMRKYNKHHVTIFPFSYEPLQCARRIQTTTCSLAAVQACPAPPPSPVVAFHVGCGVRHA